jgi:hypothetical protein
MQSVIEGQGAEPLAFFFGALVRRGFRVLLRPVVQAEGGSQQAASDKR